MADEAPVGGDTPSNALAILESLPDDQRKALVAALIKPDDLPKLVENRVTATWSGPLPPARELAKFSDAIPDGANRIVNAWETEGKHRRGLETKGQWMAAGLGAGGIVGSVVCALYGQPWVAGVMIVAVMAGIGLTGILNIWFGNN